MIFESRHNPSNIEDDLEYYPDPDFLGFVFRQMNNIVNFPGNCFQNVQFPLTAC